MLLLQHRSAATDFWSGPPEIQPHEVEKNSVLGDGSFGTVYKGRCRSKDVAIKVLHKQDVDQKTLEAFKREVDVMSKIYHPNISLFMGACFVPGSLMIVTELVPKGNLEDMLQNPNIQLSLSTRMKMSRDAALGMTWLHGSNPQFIHRDLKTSNLLVDEQFRIKLCDFGLSQIKRRGEDLMDGADGAKVRPRVHLAKATRTEMAQEIITDFVLQGTPLWMAPEVLSGQPFNEKADVYSFGIVLWEILTRREPFEEFESFEEFRQAVCVHHVRPPIPQGTLPRLGTLISACWDPDPNRRPSFPQIVQEFDHIIVECAVSDETGRTLWKEFFMKQTRVVWSEFLEAFSRILEHYRYPMQFRLLPSQVSYDDLMTASDFQLEEFSTRSLQNSAMVREVLETRPQRPAAMLTDETDEDLDAAERLLLSIKCLRAIFTVDAKNRDGAMTDGEPEVDMEKFGNMCQWFGPIVNMKKSQVVILDNVRELLNKPWFHGDIETAEAELILKQRPVGTFLIRFSSIVGHYTISKVDTNRITHQRIMHQASVVMMQVAVGSFSLFSFPGWRVFDLQACIIRFTTRISCVHCRRAWASTKLSRLSLFQAV